MYAKYINDHLIDTGVPSHIMYNGAHFFNPSDPDVLASAGFYPVDETESPGEGYSARYSFDGSRISQTWVQDQVGDVPEPPHVYSNLKILLAAREAGFLPDLISMIEADPETKWIWDASNTIEDNELLAAYLPAIAQAIGKTPEEVRAFLDENCLAE